MRDSAGKIGMSKSRSTKTISEKLTDCLQEEWKKNLIPSQNILWIMSLLEHSYVASVSLLKAYG